MRALEPYIQRVRGSTQLRLTKYFAAAATTFLGGVVIYPIFTNFASGLLDETFKDNIVISIAVLSEFIAVSIFVWARRERARLVAEFGLFVKSESLSPENLRFEVVGPKIEPANLSRRPYVENTYIPRVAVHYDDRHEAASARTYDERQLLTILEEGYSFLLVGAPTEGKSRTLLEVCRKLKGFIVVQPKANQPSDDAIELLRGKDVLCLFDDINMSVENGVDLFAFYSRIASVARRRAVAAACRDGIELAAVEVIGATSPIQRLYENFRYRLYLRKASTDEKESLKEKLGDRTKRSFPTLGAVSMRGAFDLMYKRFNQLDRTSRETLFALQLLVTSGVEPATQKQLAAVLAGVFDHEPTTIRIKESLDILTQNSFCASTGDFDPVVPEAAFISSAEAMGNYRNGRDPENDFDRLVQSLINIDDTQALFRLAMACADRGQQAKALFTWRSILSRIPPNRVDRVTEAARAMHNAGIALLNLGRDIEAMETFEEVKRRFSNESDPNIVANVDSASLAIGTLYEQQDKYSEAFEIIEGVISAQSNDSRARPKWIYAKAICIKCQALIRVDGYEEALKLLNPVLAQAAHDDDAAMRESMAFALFTKSRCLALLDRRPEQLNVLRMLFEKYGNDARVKRFLVLARTFIPYSFEEHVLPVHTVEEHLPILAYLDSELIETKRAHTLARIHMGVSLMERGEIDEALTRFREIIKEYRPGKQADIADYIARAYGNCALRLADLDRHRDAVACLQEIVSTFSEETSVDCKRTMAKTLMFMAACYYHLLMVDEGDRYCNIALERYRSVPDPELQEVLAQTVQLLDEIKEARILIEKMDLMVVAAAKALNKARSAVEHDDPASALQLYEDITSLYGQTDNEDLLRHVKCALLEKAEILARAGDRLAECECFQQLAQLLENREEHEFRRTVKDAQERVRFLRGDQDRK